MSQKLTRQMKRKLGRRLDKLPQGARALLASHLSLMASDKKHLLDWRHYRIERFFGIPRRTAWSNARRFIRIK